MLLADIHPHALQLLPSSRGERSLEFVKTKSAYSPEYSHSTNSFAPSSRRLPMIDHAIHIAEEALFGADAVDRSLHIQHFKSPHNPLLTPQCDYSV